MSDRLNQLAINDEGFVFDPVTGESYTANQTGVAGLQGVKAGKSIQEIATQITTEFDVSHDQAERDLIDFINHLKIQKLL